MVIYQFVAIFVLFLYLEIGCFASMHIFACCFHVCFVWTSLITSFMFFSPSTRALGSLFPLGLPGNMGETDCVSSYTYRSAWLRDASVKVIGKEAFAVL